MTLRSEEFGLAGRAHVCYVMYERSVFECGIRVPGGSRFLSDTQHV
jgi:hypothetical protein